jgi:hypothetical protein
MRIVSKLILKFSKQKPGRPKLQQSVQKRTPVLLGFQNGLGSPLFNLDQINEVSERNNILWFSDEPDGCDGIRASWLNPETLATPDKGEPYVKDPGALPSRNSSS